MTTKPENIDDIEGSELNEAVLEIPDSDDLDFTDILGKLDFSILDKNVIEQEKKLKQQQAISSIEDSSSSKVFEDNSKILEEQVQNVESEYQSLFDIAFQVVNFFMKKQGITPLSDDEKDNLTKSVLNLIKPKSMKSIEKVQEFLNKSTNITGYVQFFMTLLSIILVRADQFKPLLKKHNKEQNF